MLEPTTLRLPPSDLGFRDAPMMQSGDDSGDSDSTTVPQIFDPELLKLLRGLNRTQLKPSLRLLRQCRDLTSEGHIYRFLMLITEFVLGETGVLLALPDNTPSRTRRAWEMMEERFSEDGKTLRQFQEALLFSIIRDGDSHIYMDPRAVLIDSAAVEYPTDQEFTEFTVFERRPVGEGYVVKTGDGDRFFPESSIIQMKHVKDEQFRRGVPWIAYALPIVNAIDRYATSFLTGADRASKMPMYGKIPPNAPPAVRDRLETDGMPINSDKIPFVPDGVEFVPLDIAKNFEGASFADIQAAKLAAVAASLVSTYDFVSGDVSRSNMSSLQSANVTNQAFVKLLQRMVGDTTKRMFARWLMFGLAGRTLPDSSLNINMRDVKIRLPRVASVIPHREAQVDQILVNSGIISPQTIMEQRGFDPDVEIERILEYKRRMGTPNE